MTVIDLDATIVFAASGERQRGGHVQGRHRLLPEPGDLDNTHETLVIDPRPGNATSNCATDNIAALDTAVSRLPAAFRRRILVRPDGAGFSRELLSTSPQAAASEAGAGTSPSAGRAQSGRSRRSSGSPSTPASPRSARTGTC